MKVLVTGASGLLGKELVRELLSRGYTVVAIYNRNPIGIESNELVKVKLDITNRATLEDLILKMQPNIIVHAAAYTDVDGCELRKDLAWRVNVEATRSIVKAARIVKSYLIYISTDYVFDGEKGMYGEEDIPNPVNYYGLTKLIGEEIVKSSELEHIIIRTSAIYGVGGSKKSFAEFVAEELSKGRKVYALYDQYISPTLNTLLAQALMEVIELRLSGVLHIAGERMNRYKFALKIAEVLGLSKSLIKKVDMKSMSKWVAKRPRDSSLNTEKSRKILKTPFYNTQLALKLFRDQWLKRRGTHHAIQKL